MDEYSIGPRHEIKDGFVFYSQNQSGVSEAILLSNPPRAYAYETPYIYVEQPLEAQIDFVNRNKLERAIVVADNISFITQCPTLKYLTIYPSMTAGPKFDYSPLYDMPDLKSLACRTIYEGFRNSADRKVRKFSTQIDYSRIKGNLIDINTPSSVKGHLNYNQVKTLRSLSLDGYRGENLQDAFSSPVLDTLWMLFSSIQSLEGIEQSERMQCIFLHRLYSLRDISALAKVKKTLRALLIDSCPNITDFSVLEELENLELLEIHGKNQLPSLQFIRKLKKLKTLHFTVNILDGDLTPCLDLEWASYWPNRRHYNLKNTDLPKKKDSSRGNDNIEEWRRIDF